MISAWLGVMLGGAFGASLRFLLVLIIPTNTVFLWPTFVANIGGACMIGLFLGLTQKYTLPVFWTYFIQIGFLGSLTTFSTFIAEIAFLQQKTQYVWMVLYPAISIMLGMGAYYLGYFLTKHI